MGKQWYHGTGELVYSNHKDIIDAQTVSGYAVVYEWDEDATGHAPYVPFGLYWRQKLDVHAKALTVCPLPIFKSTLLMA